MSASKSKSSPRSVGRKVKAKKTQSFIPESVQSFIARRLVDGVAGGFLACGVFALIALLTYKSSDPSANSAGGLVGGGAVQNWMGASGAWLSDMLIQPLGAGALVLAVGLILWSLRTWRRHILSPFGLRVCALIGASFAFCVAVAQVPSDWTPHIYLGGAFGTLALNGIAPLFANVPSAVTYGVLPVMGVVSFVCFLYAMAVTRAEIAWFFATVRMIAIHIAVVMMNGVIAFRNWLHRYNNPDYVPQPLFKVSLAMPQLPSIGLPAGVSRDGVEQVEPIAVSAPIRADIPAQAAPSPQSPDAQPVRAVQAQPPVPAPVQPQEGLSIPVVKPKGALEKSGKASGQNSFALDGAEWELPSVGLLEAVPDQQDNHLNEDALRRNAQLLQNVLADFKIEGEIVSIHPGPVVTLYELEPAPGTKSSRVISLADDIARSMAAISVRCAVVPGRNVIGIEIPNKTRQVVFMQDMLTSREFDKSKQHLPLVLGKDIGGQPILADLAKMPHLLVAGTTGSGKSVAVNTMILSLLYRLPPEKCRMIMIDPKMLELSVYDDIPHLLSPVVTEPGKAIVALKWAVQEMENRYRAMSKVGVRNIEGYNARMREAQESGEVLEERVATGFDETGAPTYEMREMDTEEKPYIVVIVDEFADLMLVAGKDVENAIQRLAQMARAAGIHLIMATQRPSVDVITGVVKANFPTRISFQVTSKIDSRTILGEGGAEQLLGMGDMLYMAPGGKIKRVHGPFVSDDDVEKVVTFLKKQRPPSYLDSVTDGEDGDFGGSEVMNAMFGGSDGGSSDVDELYDQAVAVVAREGKASTSFIQRHLQIGYNRAARIMEEMERQGVVSPANATGKRQILVQDHSEY